MPRNTSDPAWQRDDNARIVLSGSWSLLVDRRRRRQLLDGFAQLDSPRDYKWDLRQVDSLDSTGTLLLWELWNGRLPERLDCSDDQRHLFTWLADAAPLAGEPARRASTGRLERLGIGIAAVLKTGGGILVLAGQLMLDVAYCARHPRSIPWKEISANIYRIGASAMLLLGCIGFLIGAVMTIQVGLVLEQFGASNMVIGMMSTAIPRELGAIVVGLLMSGRTGSAMTASIGAMHITEEYSALQALGSSPSLRLALPRVAGAAIAMPLLVVWTNCTVLLGGALAAHAGLAINYRLFLEQCLQDVQIVNVWIGLGKGVLFGIVIALLGCYFGMSSSPDTESLSNNTTVSVVASLTAILLLDASLGAALTNVGLL
ncbi:MAG TPA: ABC transporter permease [Rhodanobacteraceae bacterium]|nr:ABC transporter permease [Rhodanobacteraceae bacterium]